MVFADLNSAMRKSCISYLIQPLRRKDLSSRESANLCNQSPVLTASFFEQQAEETYPQGLQSNHSHWRKIWRYLVDCHLFSVSKLVCGLASRSNLLHPFGKALPCGPRSWCIFSSDPNVPFPIHLMTPKNKCYLWEISLL